MQNSMYSTAAATVKPVAECGCGGKRIFSSNYTGERKDLVMHRVQGADRMEDDDDAIDDAGLGLASPLSLPPFKRTKAKKVCSLGLRSPPENFYNAVPPSSPLLEILECARARASLMAGKQGPHMHSHPWAPSALSLQGQSQELNLAIGHYKREGKKGRGDRGHYIPSLGTRLYERPRSAGL